MTLSMNLMEINPKINEDINPIKIDEKFIVKAVASSFINSKMALPRIIGRLRRKENSAASLLFTPHTIALVIVEPLREIPGNIANPWKIPIKKLVG